MTSRTSNTKHVLAGLIFVGIGIFFGGYALATLDMGTARNMGPGYFPIVLSGLMIVLGAAASVNARGRPGTPITATPWRGLGLLFLAPIVFGLTVEGLGLFPAVALTVFLTSFASRRAKLGFALALSLGVSAFCTLVFHYGLGIPIPLIGSWLTW